MNRIWMLVIGCALIILIAGSAQFLFPRRATAPQPSILDLPLVENNATTSDSTTVTIPANTPSKPIVSAPSIVKGDSIASWNLSSAYTDRPDLIAKAEAEIKRLSNLIGKGEYTDMTLYVSIANQYGLLGDGKHEYEYLGYAIEAGGATTGLPWHNLGVLMERLGALQTARVAYEKATLVQPELKQWHYAYLAFLTSRMKDDATDIEKAFVAAKENIGNDADLLQLYSEWKKL